MKKISLIFFILFSYQLHADVFVDPYFGIMMGGSAETAGSESTISGFDMGSRFGWTNMGLFAGADYRYSNFSIDEGNDPKITTTQWGAVLGYDFPFFLRIYGEYIVHAEIEDDNDESLTKWVVWDREVQENASGFMSQEKTPQSTVEEIMNRGVTVSPSKKKLPKRPKQSHQIDNLKAFTLE